MPGVLPATGSMIAMGRVNRAFTDWIPGTGGDADGGISPFSGGGKNIKLSATLGSYPAVYGGVNTGAGNKISLSASFAGKSYPYTY